MGISLQRSFFLNLLVTTDQRDRMASAADTLTEPHVLAHAKQRLFPDPDEPDTYAVCDTQFATAEWSPGRRIGPSVRERTEYPDYS